MMQSINIGLRRIGWIAALALCACSGGAGEDSSGEQPGPAGLERGASVETASDPQQARTVNLEEIEVARIDMENGLFVGWYEPAPGVVLVGGNIVYPHEPVILDPALSTVEQFRALAPEREVPAALLEAEALRQHFAQLAEESGVKQSPAVQIERVDGMGLGDGLRFETNVDGVGIQRQALPDDSACPWSWFEGAYCGICAAPNHNSCGDWKVRWSFRTGTSSFTREDTWWTRTAACSYRGAIHYRVRVQPWYSWSTVVDVIRQTGEGWWWSRDDFSIDFDVESRVDQADGDGYHHCGTGAY